MHTGTIRVKRRRNDVWQYGRRASNYKESSTNMAAVRKEIISRALMFDIRDIRTYSGYKGDLLVQITAPDVLTLQALQKQAEILRMQTVLQEDHTMMMHALYCIIPDDVYRIKEGY